MGGEGYWTVEANGDANLIPEPGDWVPSYQTTLTGVRTIATSLNGVVILKQDGTVWTEGNNTFGQLGNSAQGPATFASVPVQVSGLSNIIEVAAGTWSNYALSSDGTVWAWGGDTIGELGNGTWTSAASPTPTEVPGLSNVVSLAANDGTAVFAVRADGTVWVWGCGASAFHGDGIVDDQSFSVPTQISGLPPISRVLVNDRGTVFALDAAGNVWAWGFDPYNLTGTDQIGAADTGASQYVTSPAPVLGVTDIVAVGDYMLLRGDGRLYLLSTSNPVGAAQLASAPTNVSSLDGPYAFADPPGD